MIRLIDPADERDMRQVFDVGVAAKSIARPWFTPPPFESWLIGRRRPDTELREELYGFFVDGRCVGASLLFVPTQDNLEKVYADIDVTPDSRRRGVGAALVRQAKDRVGELGRSAFFAETLAPGQGDDDHEYARFARSHGFTPAWREWTRHLDLPVPDSRLAELASASSARCGGYRIESYVGRVPDELLPGLAELMSMLAVDAPSGDIDFEAETYTPDRLRRIYAREAEQGRIHLISLAINEATGVVAAETELAFDETLDPVVQEGTYVHREHRGHRLGMAVKVANLQRLQRDYPDRPFVRTMNADTNEHMVAINRALGFEFVESLTEWVTDLSNP